jgi:hypothetical protein
MRRRFISTIWTPCPNVPALWTTAVGTAGGCWFSQCHPEPTVAGIAAATALVASMDRHVRTPCLPSPSQNPPSGSAWVHEIKHDGYRLIT